MSTLPRNCRQARRELLTQLSRVPLQSIAPALGAHLEGCPNCRKFAATVRAMVEAERGLRDIETLAPALHERVLERLQPTIGEVTARLRARTTRWPGLRLWVPVALAAGIAAFIVIPLRLQESAIEPAQVPVIVGLAGHATTHVSGSSRDLTPTLTLASGAALQTDTHARVAVDLNDFTRMALDEQGEVTLTAVTARDVQLNLRRGTLAGRLADPRKESVSVRIDTPFGAVLIVGTVFGVHLTATELQLDVVRGVVVVDSLKHGRLQVAAETRLTISADAHDTRGLSPQASASIETLLDPAKWSHERPVEPERNPDNDAVEQMLSVSPKRPGAARRTRPRTDSPLTAAPPAWDAVMASVTNGDCRGAREALPARLDAETSDAAAEALVAVAECFDAQGQLDAALTLYLQAAQKLSTTQAGQSALFDAGRVALRLKRFAQARSYFEQLVRDHARSPLAGEAAFRVCTATMELGETDRALACLAQFRRDHAGHRRVRDCHFLEATLWRTAKADCRRALSAYQAYLDDPGELAEQARRWWQDCRTREAGR